MRDGLDVATGAPFEGTSDAIPAAAEAGLELVVLLPDSFDPALLVVFTIVFVPEAFVDQYPHEKSEADNESRVISTTSTSAGGGNRRASLDRTSMSGSHSRQLSTPARQAPSSLRFVSPTLQQYTCNCKVVWQSKAQVFMPLCIHET